MSDPRPEDPVDERPQRRREYSGAPSTLGVAALIVLAVGVAIWWFEFRDGSGAGEGTEAGFGVVELAASANPTGKPPAAEDGRAAPDFRLRALDGGAAELSQYRGKFVLLNFWASWCGPCRAEAPDLQAFQQQMQSHGFVVVGVNQQESAADAAKFTKEFGLNYPVVLDRSGEVSVSYRVSRGLPISFLVSPQGVILKIYLGRVSSDDLSAIAKDYLS